VRRFRPARRDEGAAAVEFSLLLVPFLVLCFGLISGGVVLNDKMSLTQGVREGARYGATYPYSSANQLDYLTKVRDTARGDSYGQIGTDAATFCVGFNPANGTEIHLDNADASVQTGACPGSPTLADGYLVVIGNKPASFNLIVSQLTLTLAATSVARYEGAS